MSKLNAAWSQFWFTPVKLKKVGLFRVLVGSITLVYFLIRTLDLPLFYYDDGMLPLEQSRRLFDGVFHSPFFWFPTNPIAVQVLNALLLLFLLLMTLGIWPRLLAAGALYLHVLFIQRNFMVMYGFDKVACCWLFYLILAKSDSFFSLRPKKQIWSQDLLTPVAVRLAQVHLCVIYGYSGLEKFRGKSWWTGEALWNIISNGIVAPIDLSFLAYAPWLIYLGTYTSLLWETYFPIAVWQPQLRKPWFIFGILFHLMTAVMMNLVFFASIMLAAYALFWEEKVNADEPTSLSKRSRWPLRGKG